MNSAPRDLARQYGTRWLDEVPPEALDPGLVASVPVEWVRAHAMLPIRIEGRLCVLTADPSQVSARDDLALLVGQDLEPVVAPAEVVRAAIERCYFSRDDSPDAFLKDLASRAPAGPTALASGADDLLAAAGEAPVTRLINLILLEAVKRRASDIHIEPFVAALRVRYRVDGVLYEQASPPKHLEQALISRLKVMGRMDIAERRLPQDGMARVAVGEREIDVRVSTVPVAEGERVVLRLLDRAAALLPLETLGMSETVRAAFEPLLNRPNGMLVVCGPTGSGKTTTLYAALGRIDASRRNILTIEDPIEYQLPKIGQIQVKPKIGLTFAHGLRHVLRQDPDVVLVGETRDRETADIAVRASLTGHLVFTTLHTNDAPAVVARLVDMGVEPYLLASCLRAVLAQRLVRRLCPSCRRETTMPRGELRRYGIPLKGDDDAPIPVWEPVGCAACLEGYRDRLGVFELMLVDEVMRDRIRAGDVGADAVRAQARRAGLQDLMTDAAAKLARGETSVHEIANLAAG